MPGAIFAAAIGPLGKDLQSARGQERHSVGEALRPTVIVLIALGLLAFTATAVAAGQFIQRDRDRWSTEGARLMASGMVRGQVRLIQLATSAVIALGAVVTALVVMVLASPLAPVGALHDIDPAQGFGLDGTVAATGAGTIVLMIAAFALVSSWASRRADRATPGRSPWLANASSRPAAMAGLSLAFRTDRGRGRMWRSVTATTLATALFALGVAFVAAAVTLSATPSRYGFDADLLAVNQYGEQSPAQLRQAFADHDDVAAATGFTAANLLLDGRAVPGIAATRGEGRAHAHARPRRTGTHRPGDRRRPGHARQPRRPRRRPRTGAAHQGRSCRRRGEAVEMRIVGVATFPPVNQGGSDTPASASAPS